MKHRIIYLLSLLPLLFMGCEQVITIDLPEHVPVLVVNATFTPDSTWQASASASQAINVGTDPIAVTNASILILDNGSVVDSLTHTVDGLYVGTTGHKPVAGRNYTLQATAPGYEAVTGSDIIPTPVLPTNVSFRDSVITNQWGEQFGELSFSINDPVGDNYYLLTLMRADTIIELTDTFIYFGPVYMQIQDPLLEYDANTGSVLLNDASFDGTRREVKVQVGQYERDLGVMFLFLSTVSRDYYRYVQTMSSYSETAFNPFAEPVLVHSNLTPGMGIFAGYSSTWTIIP